MHRDVTAQPRLSLIINHAMPWFWLVHHHLLIYDHSGLAWKLFIFILKCRIPSRTLIFMSYDSQGISIIDPVNFSWLILANSNPNFVISEVSVNQVRKCFHAWGVGVFTIQKQPCKCYNCKRFLRILANFAPAQSHPCIMYFNCFCHCRAAVLNHLQI